jgi:hypothetical protein
MAQRSTAEAIELLAKAVETIAPSTLATTAGSPEIRLRSPASRAITLGQTQQSWHAASPHRKRHRLQEPAKAPKAGHQPAGSHVSLRIGERVDPPKDDARHRLNQLADSKFDE